MDAAPRCSAFERTREAEDLEWGIVTHWDPPRKIEFTWHGAASRDEDQKVEIEFRVVAYGTEVTLTHYGWEMAYVPSATACVRAASNWHAIVESCFCEFVSQQMLVTA